MGRRIGFRHLLPDALLETREDFVDIDFVPQGRFLTRRVDGRCQSVERAQGRFQIIAALGLRRLPTHDPQLRTVDGTALARGKLAEFAQALEHQRMVRRTRELLIQDGTGVVVESA